MQVTTCRRSSLDTPREQTSCPPYNYHSLSSLRHREWFKLASFPAVETRLYRQGHSRQGLPRLNPVDQGRGY